MQRIHSRLDAGSERESETLNDGRFVMTFADGVTYPQLIHIFVKYIATRPVTLPRLHLGLKRHQQLLSNSR
jgi:hypothetical protein